MDWVTNNWKDITDIVAYAIALASVVVKLTPTTRDDDWLAKIVKLLALVSLNKKA